MQIGEKLKAARGAAGLTQEQVAEAIGVSRQSVSNWENNRSYPDIASVIRLSDLYETSLDSLLKGDSAMLSHLEKSTDTVRSHARLTKAIVVGVYLVVWAVVMLTFWVGMDPSDALGFAIVDLHGIMPLATIAASFFIGFDESWGRARYALPVFFAIMFMMTAWGTFDLANMLTTDNVNLPEPVMLLPGFACSVAGISIGAGARRIADRRARV